QVQLLRCAWIITLFGIGLAEITSQQRPLRLDRSRYQQIFAPLEQIATPDAAQTPAKPRVAKCRVHRERTVKHLARFASAILGGEQKSFQREGLGIARRQSQALVQRVKCTASMAETELELGNARPDKAEIRRLGCRLARQAQGYFE